MKLLIDTSVLIDHLRGDSRATTFLADAAANHELWSVSVVRTEVLAGMRPREERATRELLDAFRWRVVDVDLADRAGVLARRYVRSHQGVDTVDFIVAAAAQVLDARLCTCNVKHFPMFGGLAPPYS